MDTEWDNLLFPDFDFDQGKQWTDILAPVVDKIQCQCGICRQYYGTEDKL